MDTRSVCIVHLGGHKVRYMHIFIFIFLREGGGAHQSGYVDSAHLIELIDQTDSTVGQHQRSRLERPLTAHWVSLNISGQTNGGGPLTCGEHRTARDLLYVPADGNTLAHLLKQSFYSPNRFLHQHFTSVAQLRSRDTKYSPAYVNFRPLFFFHQLINFSH